MTLSSQQTHYVEEGLNTAAIIENAILRHLQEVRQCTEAELNKKTRLRQKYGIFLVNRALDVLAEAGEINQIRGVYSIPVYAEDGA